jgi:uncharacterized spore protein YtfJ
MTNDQSLQHAEAEAERHAGGLPGHFLDQLATRLGGRATASAVYGEPVERGGITIIPVAKVGWGFGGGAGRGRDTKGEGDGEGSGEGGGGGAAVRPIGYIEISDGRAEFRRIADASTLLPLAPLFVAAGIGIMLILRGVARVRRS